jgi:thermolysin
VGHELTHGVTSFSWNGVYMSEPGALNEAFSDIMGAGVEFMWEPRGDARNHADYWIGEDVSEVFAPNAYAFRSMENPALFGDPDHWSKRYTGPPDAQHDWGGVHINCGIASQAFYLLIEGGTNRTSGMHVNGLGSARRADAERIFYRGFTQFLTITASFRDARAATVRAAEELFGAGSDAVLQTAAAWTAVGIE